MGADPCKAPSVDPQIRIGLTAETFGGIGRDRVWVMTQHGTHRQTYIHTYIHTSIHPYIHTYIHTPSSFPFDCFLLAFSGCFLVLPTRCEPSHRAYLASGPHLVRMDGGRGTHSYMHTTRRHTRIRYGQTDKRTDACHTYIGRASHQSASGIWAAVPLPRGTPRPARSIGGWRRRTRPPRPRRPKRDAGRAARVLQMRRRRSWRDVGERS